MKRRTPDPEWFAHLRPGDVLQRGKNGAMRVVREVSRWERLPGGEIVRGSGPLRCVTFAIRHGSWTRRCYTVYTATDLKTLGYRYVGARVRMDSALDAMIALAIGQDHGWPFFLYAEDVRGAA